MNLYLDGTLVRVGPPRHLKKTCTNRKMYTSLNVMVLAMPNDEVCWVDSNSYGSYHDAYVLTNSRLYQVFEVEGWRPFPGAVMTADPAYPGYLDWLVTPFPSATVDYDERRFNVCHQKSRWPCEPMFGRVKNKFRVMITGGIRFRKNGNLDQAVKVVQICFAIWNFILKQKNPNDEDDDMDECPVFAPLPGDVLVPAPQDEDLQPTNRRILNLYYRNF